MDKEQIHKGAIPMTHDAGLTREQIEVLREELLYAVDYMPTARMETVNDLCDLALKSREAVPDVTVEILVNGRSKDFYEGMRFAAELWESVNNASDMERHHGDPGAGAMGAVIEYRDLIRSHLPDKGKPWKAAPASAEGAEGKEK